MTATEATASAPPPSVETPVLEARDVTVRFGGLAALSNVSIAVPPAAIVGLVGPNGAGKTTLFHVLSGLLRPATGRVMLAGRDVTGATPQFRARAGMARTFQQLELFLGLSVRDHVVLGYRVRHARRRLWTDLLDLRAWRMPPRAEQARVDALLEMLDLGPVAGESVAVLPLGTARRVEIARALATGPKVVLLDEPSSGLDGRETTRLSAALRRVARDDGVSLLLVEHDVGMVLDLSSRITVLDFGQCIAEGTPDEIRKDAAVQSAYLGDEQALEARHR
jgi:branched-chain amino acid transport system ATP-binding protein